MKKKFLFICSAAILAVLTIVCAYAGQLTIDNYYPSPFGQYSSVWVYDPAGASGSITINSGIYQNGARGIAALNMASGGVNQWSIYQDSSRNLNIADSSSSATPAMTLVNGVNSVGIGTTAPVSALPPPNNNRINLDVVGKIRFGSFFINTPVLGTPHAGMGELYAVSPSSLGGTTHPDSCETYLNGDGKYWTDDDIVICPYGYTIPQATKGYIRVSADKIAVNTLATNDHSFLWGNDQVLTAGGAISDIRLKKDVVTIPDALDRVCRLRGVSFKWKDKDRDQLSHMGLIAQEVEKVFPEVVKTRTDNGMKSVDYDHLTAALIEAVKALNKESDGLEAENRKLGRRLALLEAKFNAKK